jgi:hypothetical protein
MKVLRQKRDGRWYWHWDPLLLDHGRTEVPRRDFEALFQAAMRNIHVPTLLVRGKLSDVVTEEGGGSFSRRFPARSSPTSEVPRTWWRATRMMAFSEAVVEFLEHDVRPTLSDRWAP